MSAVLKPIPSALHRGEKELPFVSYQEGMSFQLLHADIEKGLWVVRVKAQPGVTLQRHKHTGEVFAYTIAGSWKYLEYPEVNMSGSYLYEPAGSVHTLQCIENDTQVWFHMYGVNLNLDADGNVESVADGAGALAFYLAMCESMGLPRPDVLVD